MIGKNPWANCPPHGSPQSGSPAAMLDRELRESMIDVQSVAGVLDEMFDPMTGERWMPLFAGSTSPYGEESALLRTEQGLALVRLMCRYLGAENEFAINAIENRISYVVGTGMAFRFEPRDPAVDTDSPAVKREVQQLNAMLRDELDRLDFDGLQQEGVKRGERDGEFFVRSFRNFGHVSYRWIEPGQVGEDGATAGSAPFGVQTVPDDVQDVLGYWVDREFVAAHQVYHFKNNVDANVRRGVSTLWPIRKNLHRAGKLLKGISSQAQYQASISAIRYHEVGDRSSVSAFADNRANYQLRDPATGTTRRIEKLNAGRVIDSSSKIKWEFPSVGVGLDKLVLALQADLRGAAARLVMPEYMFTSDASNNNYASLLASDAPSNRMLTRLQRRYGRFFADMADDIVHAKMEVGDLPSNTLERYRLVAVPPDIANRDPKVEAEANAIKNKAGVLSARTWATRDGLDYDRERQNELDDQDIRGEQDPVDKGDDPEGGAKGAAGGA